MLSEPSLTCYEETRRSCSSVNRSANQLRSPSPVPEARSSQSLTTNWAPAPHSTLFGLLLCDRERVYRDSAAVLASRSEVRTGSGVEYPDAGRGEVSPHCKEPGRNDITTGISSHAPELGDSGYARPTHRPAHRQFLTESEMSLVSHLKRERQAPRVISRKRKPLKRGTIKSRANSDGNKSKKRSGSGDVGCARPAKAAKIKTTSNIGRKVGSELPEVKVFPDSDSEEDDPPQQSSPEQLTMMLRHVQQSQSQHQDHTPYKPQVAAARDMDWEQEHTPSEVDCMPDFAVGRGISDAGDEGKNVIERPQNAQEDLKAAQHTITKLRQETEKWDADNPLDISKAYIEAKKDRTRLTQQVEAQRQMTRNVTVERDRLRKQCEAQRGTIEKNTRLEAELLLLQAKYDQEKILRQEQQTIREDSSEDNLKSKGSAMYDNQIQNANERVHALEDENTQLVKEVETLRAAISSRTQPTSSPVPSQLSSLTDEEKREDNVRKMFVRTKRQYDVLLSVANNLTACTRSMDLTSFGEFGRHLKKLRTTLERDTGTNRVSAEEIVL